MATACSAAARYGKGFAFQRQEAAWAAASVALTRRHPRACSQVDAAERRGVYEPYAALEMFAPKEYSGTLMELAQERRGEYVELRFLNDRRCALRSSTHGDPWRPMAFRGP